MELSENEESDDENSRKEHDKSNDKKNIIGKIFIKL